MQMDQARRLKELEQENAKLRDEFLNGEIFYTMKELRVLAERWRVHYNTVRPHPSLVQIDRAGQQQLERRGVRHAPALPRRRKNSLKR